MWNWNNIMVYRLTVFAVRHDVELEQDHDTQIDAFYQ